MFPEPCQIAPQVFVVKFIFKSSSLIFNEAIAIVVLNYCFQNSHVLSVFTNKNK